MGMYLISIIHKYEDFPRKVITFDVRSFIHYECLFPNRKYYRPWSGLDRNIYKKFLFDTYISITNNRPIDRQLRMSYMPSMCIKSILHDTPTFSRHHLTN